MTKQVIRQCLETMYSPDKDGSGRIRVKTDAKTMFLNWDHGLDIQGNHVQAANLLWEALGRNKSKRYQLVTGTIGERFYHVEQEIEK